MKKASKILHFAIGSLTIFSAKNLVEKTTKNSPSPHGKGLFFKLHYPFIG
jgi:hypothetical protein